VAKRFDARNFKSPNKRYKLRRSSGLYRLLGKSRYAKLIPELTGLYEMPPSMAAQKRRPNL
jgi:hypothetical protein